MAAPMRKCLGQRLVSSLLTKNSVKFSQTTIDNAPLLSEYVKWLTLRTCSSSNSSELSPKSSHEKSFQISKAMQAYLRKAKEHENMLEHHQKEYEMGKRYLAKMMGADPENFTQEHVDEAISYLLPSGLFSKKARPMMKPPTEIFPLRKAAEFDASGRPHHYLFYTGLPNYYDLMHTIACKIESLRHRPAPESDSTSFLDGTDWITRDVLERRLLENLGSDTNFERFKRLMTKLSEHPKAALEKEFIMTYRNRLSGGTGFSQLPEICIDSKTGLEYICVTGRRKLATAKLTVWSHGTGRIDINGRGFDDFPEIHHREQIMTPLVVVDKVGAVDIEGTVEGGGDSGKAGAIRLALSIALAAFESESTRELMRQAGLLTPDPRIHEREKVGQKGARAKRTWKKR